MQKLKQKLNSKRGVSIVMALLLALICLFAGAAALTAASANIGRYTYLREDNQDYLSISSAARLLSDQFKQGSNNISADCSSGAANITYGTSFPAGGHVYKLLETNLMKPLLLQCYNNSTSGTPSASPSAAEFTVEAADIPTVTVTVTAKAPEASSVDLEVVLTTGDRTLKFPVTLKFTVDDGTSTITITEAKVERITLPAE